MAEKLTDRTAKTSNFADGDLVHVVDVSDTSQDPAGSSFKSTIGNIYGSYLAPKITSSQIVTNAADTYSVTLADTVSTNHYLFLQTASGDPFVSVTVTSYSSPKDGAILVMKLNRAGSGNLTIPGFSSVSGFSSGVYTSRYSTSLAAWASVNYLPLTVSMVEDFTDLGDVPSSYTGQANKVVKVKNDETGLEFGQEVHNLKISLTAAQIKTANSVPIDIGLPASGAGFYYRATAFDCFYSFNTEAFNSSRLLLIDTDLSLNAQLECNSLLDVSQNWNVKGVTVDGGAHYKEDSELCIIANIDSIGVGDSTVDCYITVVKVAL